MLNLYIAYISRKFEIRTQFFSIWESCSVFGLGLLRVLLSFNFCFFPIFFQVKWNLELLLTLMEIHSLVKDCKNISIKFPMGTCYPVDQSCLLKFQEVNVHALKLITSRSIVYRPPWGDKNFPHTEDGRCASSPKTSVKQTQFLLEERQHDDIIMCSLVLQFLIYVNRSTWNSRNLKWHMLLIETDDLSCQSDEAIQTLCRTDYNDNCLPWAVERFSLLYRFQYK